MTALKASQIHNERLTNRHSNPDIDVSKSKQNIVYFKTKNLTENVKNRIAEIQVKQKRKIRSDSPVAIEYMITASPEALKRMTEDEKENYFSECLKFVDSRHGDKNRLSAVLHLDETTPHLHILVFPERNGKLDSKSFFKLPELTKLQDDFAIRVGKQFGLERGVKLSEVLERGEKPHRHQSVAVYKAQKLRETEQKLAKLEQTTADLAAIESIKPQKVLLSSRLSVTPDEFETLSKQAKAYAVTKEMLQKRSKSLIEREYDVSNRETLLGNREALEKRNRQLTGENFSLCRLLDAEKEKNKTLNSQLKQFSDYEENKTKLKDTQAELDEIRSQLDNEKKEHEETEKNFKSARKFYSQLLEGIHLVTEKYFNDLVINNKRICTLQLQDLASFFVNYFAEHIRENKEQSQTKQVNRQKKGPER